MKAARLGTLESYLRVPGIGAIVPSTVKSTTMVHMHLFNAAIRFLLELAAIGFIAGAASYATHGADANLLAAPAAFVVVTGYWALFLSPKARFRTQDPVRLILELAVFVTAVLAAWYITTPIVAIVLAAIYVANLTLLFKYGQRSGDPITGRPLSDNEGQ